MEHPVRGVRFVVGACQRGAPAKLDGTVQYSTVSAVCDTRRHSTQTASRRQSASAEYNRRLARGNWATSLIWRRVHKVAAGTNLNGCLLESTLNFRERNYAFTRLELVDKQELLPRRPSIRLTGSERTPWATWPGRRRNFLFETCRTRCRVWQSSSFVSDLSSPASGK